jgi:hypothetical protein
LCLGVTGPALVVIEVVHDELAVLLVNESRSE